MKVGLDIAEIFYGRYHRLRNGVTDYGTHYVLLEVLIANLLNRLNQMKNLTYSQAHKPLSKKSYIPKS